MTNDKASADSLPVMLTLPEVALALRVSVRQLQDPTWLVRLRAVKVGRKWLVSRDTIAQVLRGQG